MGESERAAFLERNRRELAGCYLADPDNPYQQSGRSSGVANWEEKRRGFADCVHRSGSFLDVGCANGLLLQTVAEWVGERGLTIEPFGRDVIEGLVDVARQRVSHGRFWVANAWDREPPRHFTFVRTNLEHVLPGDRRRFVLRQFSWVEPGGRLIVSYQRDRGAPKVDVPAFVESIGLAVGGLAGDEDPPVVSVDIPASNRPA